jgi:hypothetical protein
VLAARLKQLLLFRAEAAHYVAALQAHVSWSLLGEAAPRFEAQLRVRRRNRACTCTA